MMPGFHLSFLGVVAFAAMLPACGAPPPVKQHFPGHQYSVRDPQFHRSMTALMGVPDVEGNAVTTLINGDEFFPAMLNAIDSAKKSITCETYVYWSGQIGIQFAQAFADRARAGVKVHVIIDDIGSDQFDPKYRKLMVDAGVHFVHYRPMINFILPTNLKRMNHRTHRKLLVVDGQVGFIGGAGIADMWLGDARNASQWRDTHFKVEGPVVAYLQGAFADNWREVTGELLDGPDYFPAIRPAGSLRGTVCLGSPERGSAMMQLMYLLAMNAAEHSIVLGTSYFVPDDLMMKALLEARRRGVEIRILVPGPHIDVPIVREASRSSWKALLDAGVHLYEYQPAMYHCKILIVDGLWTSVGSSNVDPRSFRLNDETNLCIHDAGFARRQLEDFEKDLARSRRITLDQLKRRPFTDRVTEFFSSLLTPLL